MIIVLTFGQVGPLPQILSFPILSTAQAHRLYEDG